MVSSETYQHIIDTSLGFAYNASTEVLGIKNWLLTIYEISTSKHPDF